MSKIELTPREKEVLVALVKGLDNKAIAKELNVTHHTIKAHLSSILQKFGCKNRTDTALYAIRHGIIRLPD
ncbi:MAG: response regulator transcription factor [Cyanobacteria bacterium SIG32]|nr:response regulator transcription factor [Cyanobacteria bacterium SIG32]